MKFTIKLVGHLDHGRFDYPNHELSHYGQFDEKATAEGILQKRGWTKVDARRGDDWVVMAGENRTVLAKIVEIKAGSVGIAEPRDLPKALSKKAA